MPTIELIQQNRVNPRSAWLLEQANNETSQFGEDGIIATIFATIGTRSKWCVEAGAWDGKYLSNTHALMDKGWSGAFIEGNAQKFLALQDTYRDNPRAHLIADLIGFGPDNGLDKLLAQTPLPGEFDLLSLDIDGLDYYVWEALSRYRPRVVVIEFNPTVPNDVIFIQDRDATLNQGCSLLALIRLGKEKGYELISVTTCNGIFVVAEEFSPFRIPDNSIDAMHSATLSGRVFQGYDGTLFTAGMPRLLWSEREIHFEDIQVLTPEERRYGDAPPPR